jgi:hypothetical protein
VDEGSHASRSFEGGLNHRSNLEHDSYPEADCATPSFVLSFVTLHAGHVESRQMKSEGMPRRTCRYRNKIHMYVKTAG